VAQRLGVEAMTDLEEMKSLIVTTVRDEELASSACFEIDAYAKLWPFVFMVNDWAIWNKGKTALRPEVVHWLEGVGAAHDVHLFLSGGGLVGFKEIDAASQFERRWSREGQMPSNQAFRALHQDWNPHPAKSTFEPPYRDVA
jgi:hypothetical protein